MAKKTKMRKATPEETHRLTHGMVDAKPDNRGTWGTNKRGYILPNGDKVYIAVK